MLMFSQSVAPLSSNMFIISANPTEEYYNDDYNTEYDYGDEEPSMNDVLSHIPKIVSNSVKLDVDNW